MLRDVALSRLTTTHLSQKKRHPQMKSLRSVSYTHLDVYKRQVCGRPVYVYAGEETVTRGLYAYACQALDPRNTFDAALARTFGASEVCSPTQSLSLIHI